MSRINKYISGFLLVVFVFVLVPKEAFHSLTGHEDTIDSYLGYTSISPKHIHCEILQFQFSGFTQPQDVFIPSCTVFSSSLLIHQPGIILAGVSDDLRTRGPPSITSAS